MLLKDIMPAYKHYRTFIITSVLLLFLFENLYPDNTYTQPINTPEITISQLWQEWLKEDKTENLFSSEKLRAIQETMLNAGIKSHPYLTYAVIREAQRIAKSKPDFALQLLDFFEIAYQDISPEPYFLSAKILFKYKKEYGKGILKIMDGVGIYLKNSIYILELLGNTSIFVFLALILAFTIFIIIMLIKYLKLMLHDFGDFFPVFVPRFASALLGITVLLLPFVFHTGAGVILLFWAVILAGYLGNRERAMFYFSGILLILLPFILNFFGSFILSVTENGIIEMEYVRNGYWDNNILQKLETLSQKDPTNKEIKFSIALIYKKSGNLEKAMEIYRELNDSYLGLKVKNNLGNIYFALGKIDSALELYQEVIKQNDSISEAHYNLGQLLILKDPLGTEGVDEFNKAKQLSSDLISYFTKIYDGKNFNRRTIDMNLSRRDILRNFFKFSPEKINLFSSAIPQLLPLRTEWNTSVLGFGIIILIMVFSALFSKFNLVSSFCTKCYGVVCPRCTTGIEKLNYCNNCNKAFLQKSVTTEKELKKYERIRTLRKSIRSQLLRIINIVLPGSGLIYNDFTGLGFFLLTIILALLLRIIIGVSPVSYGLHIVHVPYFIFNLILIFILLIFYLISQIVFYRNE